MDYNLNIDSLVSMSPWLATPHQTCRASLDRDGTRARPVRSHELRSTVRYKSFLFLAAAAAHLVDEFRPTDSNSTALLIIYIYIHILYPNN